MEEVIRSSAMYNAVFSRGPDAQRAAGTSAGTHRRTPPF
jgi:hypothetical protein